MPNQCLLRLGQSSYPSMTGVWQMKFRCPLQAGLATAPNSHPTPSQLQEGKFSITPSFQNESSKQRRASFLILFLL